MTQTPNDPIPEETAKPKGVSPVFWIVGGCDFLGIMVPQLMGGEGLEPPTTSV
jgi:hypothetical protein